MYSHQPSKELEFYDFGEALSIPSISLKKGEVARLDEADIVRLPRAAINPRTSFTT